MKNGSLLGSKSASTQRARYGRSSQQIHSPLKIFVCSTYRDLVTERESVIGVIESLKLERESMEFFGARSNRPIETCLAEVDRSDILVVIIGHLYGSLVPGRRISFTEAEYTEAHRLGKPCLVYMRDENVPILPKDIERDGDKIKLLDHFRETLRTRHVVDTFTGFSDLAVKVSDAMNRTVRELKGVVGAKEKYLELLKQGVYAWNAWRAGNPAIDLSGVNFRGAKFRDVHFIGAQLAGTDFSEADLRGADLQGADLSGAQLIGANLQNARLTNANLSETNLTRANLNSADLTKANLAYARLIETNLEKAKLEDCYVYGISAWSVHLEGAWQSGLVISPPHEPAITVDDIEVAQLNYLLLNSNKVSNLISTFSSKSVLVLGNFRERKAIADAIRTALHQRTFLPMFFDLERPSQRDFTETIRKLAGMSLFMIVDITVSKSSPLELNAILPDYNIPTVPIIAEGKRPFAMFADLRKYPWVLAPLIYNSVHNLIAAFDQAIVQPALKVRDELTLKKSRILKSQV